jgi:transposase
MEDVLDLYAKPYDPREPVICFDEKSKQLLKETRRTQYSGNRMLIKRDYEYKRNGTRNIFVAVEPKGGWRDATVTCRRTRKDFAEEIRRLTQLPRYQHINAIHIVLDNLNTHCAGSLVEAFGVEKAVAIMRRIRFHYTPKHASWLNMAEIELSVLSRQAIKGRVPDEITLKERIVRWQEKRNQAHAVIQWRFTKQDAKRIFKYKVGKLS